jgi:hypothetical protein
LNRINHSELRKANVLFSHQSSSEVPDTGIHAEWVEGKKEYKLMKVMNNAKMQNFP